MTDEKEKTAILGSTAAGTITFPDGLLGNVLPYSPPKLSWGKKAKNWFYRNEWWIRTAISGATLLGVVWLVVR